MTVPELESDVGMTKRSPNFFTRNKYALFLSLVLAGVFVAVFDYRGAWQDNQMMCDESFYVEMAAKLWDLKFGKAIIGEKPLDNIGFSPLYRDLMTPFVAVFFDAQTGFKIWKFSLYLCTSLLFFVVISRISNDWIGFVCAIHFTLGHALYGSGTYTVLVITFILVGMFFLQRRGNYLGISIGVLGLGALVRPELMSITFILLLLVIIFSRAFILSRRFVFQVTPFVLAFIVLLYWHDSSVMRIPELFSKGTAAIESFLTQSMFENGYFKKYMDAPSRNDLSMEVIGKVFKEEFGVEQPRYLSIPELIKRNPEVMKKHYVWVLNRAKGNIPGAFFILEYKDHSSRWILFLVTALLPCLFWKRLRKIKAGVLFTARPSKELVFLALAPLSVIVPWIVAAAPEQQYVVMLAPTLYSVLAMLWILMGQMLERAWTIASSKPAVVALFKFIRGQQ